MRSFLIYGTLLMFFGGTVPESLDDEIPFQCGNYCFDIVKPTLSYLENLQNRVDACEAAVPSGTLARIAQIDMKLETLGRQLAIEETMHRDTRNQLFRLQRNSDPSPTSENKKKLYQKLGSKSYYIESENRETWHGALKKCHKLGGHLVSLQSQEEIDALSGKLQEYTGYWTDLTDQFKDGEYVSISTGLNGAFFKWGQNEPNHGPEHCVELHTFQGPPIMNDNLCTADKFFICESSMDE